jgi:hypothetical protein
VVELTFDNVHFTRDNPNVPSDLEQMPHLLSVLEQNGALLSNNHSPLIAHTADDILTTLTGVYPSKHGQPVANGYRTYNADGSSSSASSFAYWTDPVASSNPAATDQTPTMIDQAGKIAPAPWVPFTRSGCDVGAAATANMEIENPGTDIPVIYGTGSPEWIQYQKDPNKFKDQEVADYEGVSIHCTHGSAVCARSQRAVADKLPDEPGGYSGFQGLFGHKYVAPVIGGTGPGNDTLTDLNGDPITDPFTNTNGFPGFDISAAQTLAYLADMQEHGVPVTYGYIEDAHDDHSGKTDNALGPGDSTHEDQLKADDQAFGTFFDRLAKDGITPANTLFVVSSDENDHFAGVQQQGCDGVTTACNYGKGQIGELNTNVTGLLASQAGDKSSNYQVRADSAPNFYVNGAPPPGDPGARTLEREAGKLQIPDPYLGKTVPLTNLLADQVEQNILHMVTADPARTPTFTDFANPDTFVNKAGTTCSGPKSSDQTATSNPCVFIGPGFAWIHGDVSPDINTTWLGLAGPGVARVGVDRSTWADHTDIRPTVMNLTGLHDDYQHDGRVLFEDVHTAAASSSNRSDRDTLLQLAEVYKQLDGAVGQFGLDTLQASTRALESAGPGDATYQKLERQLSDLGHHRDQLVARMATVLTSAANGHPIDQGQARQMINQGHDQLNQARALAGQGN